MQIPWPILDVLSHRGIEDAEDFSRSPTWRDMPSPSTLPGVSEVVSRIREAIRSQDRIAVYGDYDCDGALSTAILQATLNKLGTRPSVYLPHRDEGYGFTEEAVHRFSRSGSQDLARQMFVPPRGRGAERIR